MLTFSKYIYNVCLVVHLSSKHNLLYQYHIFWYQKNVLFIEKINRLVLFLNTFLNKRRILLHDILNNNCQLCILGTRICLECTPIHRHITKGHNEPLGNGTTVSAYRTKRVDETSSSCSAAALTEMPIRKFRINHTCHGKLTFLTKNLSLKCNCRKGLHYELA